LGIKDVEYKNMETLKKLLSRPTRKIFSPNGTLRGGI